MSDLPVVAVRGEAIRDVDPEIASFTVTVVARDRQRADALQRLTARQDAVRAILDRYPEAVEKRATTSVTISPEIKRGSGEKISGYAARVSTTVTVVDFSVLGELILRLSEEDLTSVYGPEWSLRPGSPAYREARHAAIADALARARDYADALGAEITGLQALADSGLLGAGYAEPQPALSLGYAPRGGSGSAPTLELDPRQQRVSATIEARFTITAPTLVARPAD